VLQAFGAEEMEPRPASVERDVIVARHVIPSRTVLKERREHSASIVTPQNWRWGIAFWFVAFCCPMIGRATSIIILVQAESIAVGADSYVINGPNLEIQCKIRTMNGFLVVISGVPYDRNIGFDSFDWLLSQRTKPEPLTPL
jgi:hypothetical protein